LKTIKISNIAGRLVAAVWITTSIVWAQPAAAFSLGAPEVLSRMGEPVHLRIPVSLANDEADLRAAMADPSIFKALGYTYPRSWQKLAMAVHQTPQGTFLDISGGLTSLSSVPVVLDITTNRGKVVRHFSATLLDKQLATPKTADAPAPVPQPGKAAENKSAPTVKQAALAPTPVVAEAVATRAYDFEENLNKRLDRLEATLSEAVVGVTTALAETRIAQENASARATRDDVIWLGGAALAGLLIGGAIFGGRRSGIQTGVRVRLVGYGRKAIEGEFVREVRDRNKPFAYRLADMIAGGPKTVEFRPLETTMGKQIETQGKQLIDNVPSEPAPAPVGSAEMSPTEAESSAGRLARERRGTRKGINLVSATTTAQAASQELSGVAAMH